MAVIAAGRNLVASPPLHSNPYVPWEPREALRRAYLAAATGTGPPEALCEAPIAPATAGLWIILPKDAEVAAGRLEAVASTVAGTIYRIAPDLCGSPLGAHGRWPCGPFARPWRRRPLGAQGRQSSAADPAGRQAMDRPGSYGQAPGRLAPASPRSGTPPDRLFWRI